VETVDYKSIDPFESEKFPRPSAKDDSTIAEIPGVELPMEKTRTMAISSSAPTLPIIADEKEPERKPVGAKLKKPRPVLSLQVSLSGGMEAESVREEVSDTIKAMSFSASHSTHHLGGASSSSAVSSSSSSLAALHAAGSNSTICLSPHGGTLHMGKLSIMENGIYANDNSSASSSFTSIAASKGSSLDFAEKSDSHDYAKTHQHHNHLKKGPRRSDPLSASFGGKADFVEIGTLGSGAR
jgi:hypothetical protein